MTLGETRQQTEKSTEFKLSQLTIYLLKCRCVRWECSVSVPSVLVSAGPASPGPQRHSRVLTIIITIPNLAHTPTHQQPPIY